MKKKDENGIFYRIVLPVIVASITTIIYRLITGSY